jgi:hypothetical protein
VRRVRPQLEMIFSVSWSEEEKFNVAHAKNESQKSWVGTVCLACLKSANSAWVGTAWHA